MIRGRSQADTMPGRAHAEFRGSAADRFCAWAGRARRRVVFSVHSLDAQGGVERAGLDGPGVLLGVQRDGAGRRVLWCAAIRGGVLPSKVRRAIALLRQDGRGELHHCAVLGGLPACEALVSELGLPPLDNTDPLPLAS